MTRDSYLIVRPLLHVCCFVFAVSFDWTRGKSADQLPAWKAGTAKAVITPKTLMAMAGYAARTEPAEGTEQDLFAKALAIEDRGGNRVVLLTMDLIGVLGR